MVKGDQDALKQSKLYMENQDIFNYYLQCIIEFSQSFDPTETLLIIANDPERREFIHGALEELVPLNYILTDLWPKLGFLPIDQNNPGVALIAEFMLNELILKNSESLDKLDLKHLKELFSGDGDEEENEEEMDEEMRQVMEDMEAEALAEQEGKDADDDDLEVPVKNDDGKEDSNYEDEEYNEDKESSKKLRRSEQQKDISQQ